MLGEGSVLRTAAKYDLSYLIIILSSRFQPKVMRYTKKQESKTIKRTTKKRTTKADIRAQMRDLADKDFQAAVINMSTHLKEVVSRMKAGLPWWSRG